MKDIAHAPTTPKDWHEHNGDKFTHALALGIAEAMTEDERLSSGIDPDNADDDWVAAIGDVSAALTRLIDGAEQDERSESVTLDQIGGYELVYGR